VKESTAMQKKDLWLSTKNPQEIIETSAIQ
jgi:hypothetical protein